MSRIFLSHSSKNNDSAVALRDWLSAQGWDDVFLDLDPQRGITAGERWEHSLNQAALRCEAVLFLVSRAWLASDWCLKEFNLAHRLNKRLFFLLIEDIPITELPATLTGTWQLVPLASGRDHVMLRAILPGSQDEALVTFSQEGLTRLRIGLERAGLDARFFKWPPESDPKRSPYRGLLPLEAADAGIFFGREAPTIEAIDRIRGMKDGAAPRLLVLLGASGAGKSSFLRAGLLPRLVRDDRNYFVLPVVRPERAAINGEAGLLHSLETAFADQNISTSRTDILAAIKGGAPTFRPLLQTLMNCAGKALVMDGADVKAPVLVLAIDQGEELFLNDGSSESTALLNLLRELLTEDLPSALVVITIRSDAYEQLQTAKALEGIIQQPLSLIPMPRGAYQAVIEGPAARLKETSRQLVIEPGLTQALLSDIEEGGGRDALPLLAFTLERLFLEYGGRGRLTLEDYESLGRIKGSIEAAVERAFSAADSDPRIPRDRDARLVLLRRGLIPWLAGIDPDTGSPRRQKARTSEIPQEAQPLIDLLVEQRLLSTDIAEDTKERTIEPAHESLLRQWGSLQNWLQEDFAALTALETVKRAARDWMSNAKNEDWLAHRAGRLEDAEQLLKRPDLAGKLDAGDRAYLATCRERENASRAALERRLALQKRLSAAAAIAAVVMTAVGTLAYWQKSRADVATALAYTEKDRADRNAAESSAESTKANAEKKRADLSAAEAKTESLNVRLSQSKLLDALGNVQTSGGDAVTAMLLGDIAIRNLPEIASPADQAKLRSGLSNAIRNQKETLLLPHGSRLYSAEFFDGGKKIATADLDALSVWDSISGKRLSLLSDPVSDTGTDPGQDADGSPYGMMRFQLSDNGKFAITLGFERSYALVWSLQNSTVLFKLDAGDKINGAVFSPDSRRIVISSGAAVQFWDVSSGKLVSRMAVKQTDGSEVVAGKLAFSKSGKSLAVGSVGGAVIMDATSGKSVGTDGCKNFPGSFSPDGKRVVMLESCTGSKTAIVWDVSSGRKLLTLSGAKGNVWTAIYSPDGQRIITADRGFTAQLWDAQSGRRIAILNHYAAVYAASFSPDGKSIITASSDGTAKVWDLNGSELFKLSGHLGEVLSANFSPDGMHAVTSSIDGTSRVWSLRDPSSLSMAKGWTDDSKHYKKGDPDIKSIALNKEGSMFAAIDKDHSAYLFDTKSGKRVQFFDLTAISAIFSPDSKFISFTRPDGQVNVFNVASGQLYFSIQQPNINFLGSLFSSNGGKLLVFSEHELQIWDTTSKTLSKTVPLPPNSASLRDVILSADNTRVFGIVEPATPDSRVFALSQEISGSSSFHNFEVPAPLAEFTKAAGLTLSPDGTRLMVAFSDGKLRVWDARSQEYQREIALDSDGVDFSGPNLFSDDGETIIGTNSRNVYMFDTRTGLKIDKIYSSVEEPMGIAQANGTILILDCDPQGKGDNTWQIVSAPIFDQLPELISHVAKMVPRCLTDSQLQRYSVEGKQAAWCENKWPLSR